MSWHVCWAIWGSKFNLTLGCVIHKPHMMIMVPWVRWMLAYKSMATCQLYMKALIVFVDWWARVCHTAPDVQSLTHVGINVGGMPNAFN